MGNDCLGQAVGDFLNKIWYNPFRVIGVMKVNANMKVVTVICAVSLPVIQTRYPYMSMVKVRRSIIKQKHKQIYLPPLMY